MKIVSKETATVEKTNYLGHIQHVDICVLGFKTEKSVTIGLFDEYEDVTDLDAEYITSVGVAIQKDGDTYDKELGQKIAYNRAMRPDKAFYVEAQTRGGLHDEKTRQQFLENLKSKDLGYFSYGYEVAERKYNEKQEKLKKISSIENALSPENKVIADKLSALSPENKAQLTSYLTAIIDTCEEK